MSCEIVRRVFSCIASVLALMPGAAGAVDWSKVQGKEIVLFYPAQLSWEMLLTQSEHSGAGKFREGKNCAGCHGGEEKASGKLLVADKSSESAPIPGKPGFVSAVVKAAHDGQRLHIRLEFDPGPQPDAGMDKDFATKVAVMIDDGAVAEATRAGCWATCHDDLARMPSAGETEVTKYLTRSRAGMSRKGGGPLRPTAELDKLRAEGAFLEYWQARLNPGAAAVVVDGTVLDKRDENPAPLVAVEAADQGGKWIVTFSRALNAGAGRKEFRAGKTYTVGFSLHAGHAAKRFHYVSLEKTLTLDAGAADLVAIRD